MEIIWLIAGLLIGGIIAWLLSKNKVANTETAHSKETNELRNAAALAEERNKSLSENLAQAKTSLEDERRQTLHLSTELSKREAEYHALSEKLAEQKAEVEKLNQKFSVEFKNLANEILEEKSKKFTDQNKENLDTLLNPLREKLTDFQKKVEQSNMDGEKRGAALNEQLKNLRELNQQITHEAKSLSLALRGDSKAQGGWGEMQLESILEKAGLQKDIHYFKEKNFKNEEGANQRLDFIINLPDDKHLVLDSKVSLTAYSNYFDTEDEAEKKQFLKQHVNSILGHIKLLGDKNYQNLYDIKQPDYVMMFVANEPALTMALKEDSELYDKALRSNIVLVSTTTLLATLRTISYIWNQDLQNKNAEEIARQAGALYDKFVGFSEDLVKLGNQLGTVQNTYQESMKKLSAGSGNLVRRTQKLQELGAKTSKTQNPKLIDRALD
ncbi:hypothetical protein Oweho_2608 [Owenweeksia hongkongensis DSM 17368]|uniref:DNA recombination protein RmuC n=1 Tax=Owenweeksia hongkongensis (strain DSM 17368 / CIP 108786 / JCM 12287 / NRRL B-23963 / UST20020801) TaxID=926562 RepID=G8R8W8_OWEHD|nr:DNA recombination protein RmuC [Owenweeksia hongkongensis]AEV33576.1 hypothetical protein Oweho_2608 [Owenweeksia hongkongensis DSM 17368]